MGSDNPLRDGMVRRGDLPDNVAAPAHIGRLDRPARRDNVRAVVVGGVVVDHSIDHRVVTLVDVGSRIRRRI